jgi:tetratricopeptide (TPR) repeat protein
MKVKMNTITNRIIFTLIAFITISCSDDFVEVTSENESADNYFNSEEDYQLALIGAYDLLQSTYLNVMIGEIASDNTLAGGENPNDVLGIQEIDDMRHTPVNQQLRDIWSWMFAGVNRANYILQYQDKTVFAGNEKVIAQARFLRAYYYFELVKFFGDVPLVVDKPLEFGDQYTVGRTPKADIYDQIEADLIFAADNLPATQTQAGRITSGAANALLGKAYLYQGQYDEAAIALEKVIAGPYMLVENYKSIFEAEGENGPGSVFEIQYTDKEGAGFDCLQCSEGNVAVGFNGIRSYTGPDFESGFSFNVPTQDVVNAFETGDIRKDVAILDIEAWASETGATYGIGNEHTGYFNRKYIARQGDLNTGDANLTNPNNYRSIRFADVLLMAAEANYLRDSKDDDKAKSYLNEVRDRAGLIPVDVNGAILLDAIYAERRVELAGEGHRFFDLVRTGRAADEIEGFIAGKHELFPIPAIEIQLAGGNWDQNPNY